MEVERCLETIESRAKWLEHDREDLMAWLGRNGYKRCEPTRRERCYRVAKKMLVPWKCI
jgi:hypothetical protein